NEKLFSFVARATYAQLYPKFDLSFDSRFRRSGLFIEPDVENADSLVVAVRSWNERAYVSNVTLPFNLSSGNFSRGFNVSMRYAHNQLRFESNEVYRDRPNAQFNSLGGSISFFNRQLRATQDVATRFGQTLLMGYRQTLEEDAGQIFFLRGSLFFPGLAKTHSFSVDYGYQKQEAFNEYKFSNQFITPRGYGGSIFTNDQLFKVGFNYQLPIWYPDLAIGPLVFVKRLRANLFFDYGTSEIAAQIPDPIRQVYRSVGVELSGDFGFLRTFELPMGIQLSYRINQPDFLTERGESSFQVGFVLR
ncbi:MAG: hypothetical protein AAFO94_08350, partial [Bacteroidota bacterium]